MLPMPMLQIEMPFRITIIILCLSPKGNSFDTLLCNTQVACITLRKQSFHTLAAKGATSG